MGFLTPKKRPLVPHLAQCAISKAQKGSNSFQEEHCKVNTTLRRGELLGIGRPIWLKVQESESRLTLIENMVKKDLIVKDLDSFAKAVGKMLRSDELRFKEEERKILMGLMKLKLKDEKLNLKRLRKEKGGKNQNKISSP